MGGVEPDAAVAAGDDGHVAARGRCARQARQPCGAAAGARRRQARGAPRHVVYFYYLIFKKKMKRGIKKRQGEREFHFFSSSVVVFFFICHCFSVRIIDLATAARKKQLIAARCGEPREEKRQPKKITPS